MRARMPALQLIERPSPDVRGRPEVNGMDLSETQIYRYARHIILREDGISFGLDKVDLATKRTETGEDYATINPKGAVPAR